MGKIEKLTVTSAQVAPNGMVRVTLSGGGTVITRYVNKKFIGKWPNVGQTQDMRIQLIDGTRS